MVSSSPPPIHKHPHLAHRYFYTFDCLLDTVHRLVRETNMLAQLFLFRHLINSILISCFLSLPISWRCNVNPIPNRCVLESEPKLGFIPNFFLVSSGCDYPPPSMGGTHRLRTLRPRDTLSKGRIVQGKTFGNQLIIPKFMRLHFTGLPVLTEGCWRIGTCLPGARWDRLRACFRTDIPIKWKYNSTVL